MKKLPSKLHFATLLWGLFQKSTEAFDQLALDARKPINWFEYLIRERKALYDATADVAGVNLISTFCFLVLTTDSCCRKKLN